MSSQNPYSKQLILNQALLQLPIAQRMVCYALNYISNQIDRFISQQEKQVHAVHMHYNKKFKQLQEKSLNIIKGGPINQKQLENFHHYFTPTELKQIPEIAAQGLQLSDLCSYWIKVFKHCDFSFSKLDWELITFIQSISTNITQNSLQVVIAFYPNIILKSARYKRRVFLQNGVPVRLEGDKVEWFYKQQLTGMFPIILNNSENEDIVSIGFEYIGTLVNQIIPFSVEYYLGVINGEFSKNTSETE